MKLQGEELVNDSSPNFTVVWFTNQIFKTMYQMGQFAELLVKLDAAIKKLEDEKDEVNSSDYVFKYLQVKFIYMKAKVLRKTRQF